MRTEKVMTIAEANDPVLLLKLQYQCIEDQFIWAIDNPGDAENLEGVRYDEVVEGWSGLSKDEKEDVICKEFFPVMDEYDDKLGTIRPWHDGWTGDPS